MEILEKKTSMARSNKSKIKQKQKFSSSQLSQHGVIECFPYLGEITFYSFLNFGYMGIFDAQTQRSRTQASVLYLSDNGIKKIYRERGQWFTIRGCVKRPDGYRLS
jgi:hypothetical protein